ncbi:hypothetical protein Acr_14g0006070 [Actinidia rufa]|uniref:Reverse transcriptase zinc-binding domain-containing protein n=1 Tax=Actinidia rufa TaxID=165716 RepID=A0A7J0FQH9_9ERIC|nr:hypothetical protein Acr_14g0006070 [Actinidia rufa]
MASRLSPLLINLIDPAQAAFVQSRSMVENIYLVPELLKHYGWSRISPRCIMKIDLRKAYNTINWDFVNDVLIASIDRVDLDNIKNSSDLSVEKFPFRYLGLPVVATKLSIAQFHPFLDRVAGYISSWADKLLVAEGSLQAAKSRIEQWIIGGKFSSKAAYEFFRPQKIKLTWPKLVWHGCITPKHAFILWLGLKDRLLTRDKLQGHIEDLICPLCMAADESIDHLFFQCNVGKQVWSQIKNWIGFLRAMTTLKIVVKWMIKEATGTRIQSKAKKIGLACTVYFLWEARNERIFEGKIKHRKTIIRCIQVQVYRIIYNLFPDLIGL